MDDPGPYTPWQTIIETNSMMTGQTLGPDPDKVVFTANFQHYNERQEHAEVAGRVLFDVVLAKYFEHPS